MDAITHDQAAALANVSPRRLYQLIDEPDGPKRSSPGHFDCAEFGEWLTRRNTPDGYQAERTRLTKAQADKAELEAAELAREVARTEHIQLTWGGMVAASRAKFLGLPAKIAPLIAPPGKVAEVEDIIREKVYESLHELAGSGLPQGVPGVSGASNGDVGTAAEVDGEPVGGSVPSTVKRIKRGARKVAH